MSTRSLCRPFEWGADLVVHSTTKFLSGNGTSVGGAVIDSGRFDWSASGKFPGLAAPEPAYHGLNFQETFGDMAFTMQAHAVGLRDLGATMAPMNAFQTLLGTERSEEHTSELQSLMRISYAVFCLKKKTHTTPPRRCTQTRTDTRSHT